eukprot:5442306-Prymnesium_polylepis.2
MLVDALEDVTDPLDLLGEVRGPGGSMSVEQNLKGSMKQLDRPLALAGYRQRATLVQAPVPNDELDVLRLHHRRKGDVFCQDVPRRLPDRRQRLRHRAKVHRAKSQHPKAGIRAIVLSQIRGRGRQLGWTETEGRPPFHAVQEHSLYRVQPDYAICADAPAQELQLGAVCEEGAHHAGTRAEPIGVILPRHAQFHSLPARCTPEEDPHAVLLLLGQLLAVFGQDPAVNGLRPPTVHCERNTDRHEGQQQPKRNAEGHDCDLVRVKQRQCRPNWPLQLVCRCADAERQQSCQGHDTQQRKAERPIHVFAIR